MDLAPYTARQLRVLRDYAAGRPDNRAVTHNIFLRFCEFLLYIHISRKRTPLDELFDELDAEEWIATFTAESVIDSIFTGAMNQCKKIALAALSSPKAQTGIRLYTVDDRGREEKLGRLLGGNCVKYVSGTLDTIAEHVPSFPAMTYVMNAGVDQALVLSSKRKVVEHAFVKVALEGYKCGWDSVSLALLESVDMAWERPAHPIPPDSTDP